MKKYVEADLQIVRMNNTDIVTASVVNIGNSFTSGNHPAEAPSNRRSIWD